MKEFWFWVAIVTLLIFLNFATWMGLVYMDKKLTKTEALCVRFEEKEKKREKPSIYPKPDGADGL